MLHLILTTPLLFAAPTAAEPAPPALLVQDEDERPVEDEREGPERLEAWPEVDKDTKKLIEKELGRVRKARTPEMAEGGRAALLEIGHGAAPELLRILSKERNEDARERIAGVLAELTDARHTRLLAAEFGHKSEHVRLFALERAAAFPDTGIRAAAETAYAAAEKRADTKKEVKYELDVAALALCSSGSIEGLDVLHARALKGWGDWGGSIRAAVEGLRGPEATARVAAHLGDDRKATVAALRLLAGCGDRETAGPHVKPLLDNTDNQIRVAAINAARGIVDGDPPLDRLSVFEAVELANEWKRKL